MTNIKYLKPEKEIQYHFITDPPKGQFNLMKLLKEWMIREKNCKLQEDKNTLLGGFVDQI